MHQFAINALILAEPGRKRDGLYSLLSAVDRDLMTLTANCPALALDACRQKKVNLILVDVAVVSRGLKDFLAEVNGIDPTIIRLVIVRSIREREWALKAGADATLTTGYTTESFFKVVKSLILSRGGANKIAACAEAQPGVNPETVQKLKDLVEIAGAAPYFERGQSMALPTTSQNEETLPPSGNEAHVSPEQDLSGYYAERLQAIAELLLQLSRSTQTLKLKLAGLKQVEEQFARLVAIYQENHIDATEIQTILNRLQDIRDGHQESVDGDTAAEEKRLVYPFRPASKN